MGLDAIIISDTGEDSLSGTNPLKLRIEGRVANIQTVSNYLKHQDNLVLSIEGDEVGSWSSAPKLNGLSLFSCLSSSGFNVELIDRYYEEKEDFRRLLSDNPRAVIISTTFIHSKQALFALVQDIRGLAPDVLIVVGGPFIYLSYLLFQKLHDRDYETKPAREDFLFLHIDKEPAVDLYIISPRGEQILREALDSVKHGRPWDDLPNTAWISGGEYVFTERIDDDSNAPGLLIDWRSLPDRFFHAGVVPMQASNGCPYRCAFCNFTKDRRLMFVKPLDQLIDELEAVSDRGIRYVWFVDDNFRLGKGDIGTVCRRLIEQGFPISWMSFVRAGALSDVDAETLRRSGCVEVQLGLESADPGVLRNMNKQADPRQYEEVIGRLLAAGINISCYFIFGFPGETDETALRTRQFIRTVDAFTLEGFVSWSMFPFILSPMSPIYEREMREKYQLTGYMKDWRHFTMESGQALAHVINAFQEIENSGPIYRGDNLDSLFALAPGERKRFQSARHRLSKLAMRGRLDKRDLITAFTGILKQ